MSTNRFYITAAIPYINAKPHVGHVLEWFQADAVAKYHHSLGKTVSFTCGTDENSLKNVQAAEAAGLSTQEWLNTYANIFKEAFDFFEIGLTHFQRGSDKQKHWPGVQDLWNACKSSGDIYQKEYTGLYCVGCEAFYTEADLVDGKCPEHLKPPEEITETNYFFKLSHYQERIEQLIQTDELQVISDQYKQEMLGFVKQGLQDFSISRSTERARGIGVPVPNDPSQVMYVWFDALSIYMTAVGFGTNNSEWSEIWPADAHVIGKGITRFHAVYWIGMLLSAKLPLPRTIAVHGYLTANGQKMSKSLGNVIDPFELVERYGLEPIRYYLLKAIPSHADGDISEESFKEVYTADLANGLGNVCSRVAALSEKAQVSGGSIPDTYPKDYSEAFESYDPQQAAASIQTRITDLDGYLTQTKPWKLTGEDQTAVLHEAIEKILEIGYCLKPIMPKMSATILHHFSQNHISKLSPLFPRLD